MSNTESLITPSSSPADTIRRQAEILQLTHEAIIVHGVEDGRIIFWNRGASELYGWSEEQVVGQISHSLLPTNSPPALEEILGQIRSTGQWNGELVHTTKAGKRIIVASRWSSRKNLGGDVCDIVELNFDITAKITADERARENERLAALGAVAAVFSHEVANPLTAISSTIQSLQMQIQGGGIAKDELVHWMTVLEREINRLAVLLDDFRSLARPLKIDLQTVNLLELLEEMWLFDEPVCMAAGIKVLRDYDSIPLIKADPNKMKQAILNITKNAVEAMPEGGQLTVKTYAVKERVYLEIKDTGMGIPRDLDVFAIQNNKTERHRFGASFREADYFGT